VLLRIAITLVALALVAPAAAARGTPSWHHFAVGDGVSGELPSGWRVVDRRFTPCIDPREVLAISSFRVGAKPRLPRTGAFAVLEETDSDVDRFPARPRHLRLDSKPSGLECCVPLRAPGWIRRFHAGGRGFYAYLFLGPGASPATRAKLLTALDRLRVERFPAVRWRRSRSLGKPWAGRLVSGVQLPAFGRHFTTWDPIRWRSPDRGWRRWGNDRVVRTVLTVVNEFGARHYQRLVIGDLSRREGGPFLPKHASHQNGLDVDVYYPRLDFAPRPPARVGQINRRLAQALVRDLVRAGASRIFVGRHTGLVGPHRIVRILDGHDNHLHVRFAQ